MENAQYPFGTVVVAIVPAYNEQPYIGQAVDSLNDCKRQGIVHEVVVVSDGSNDRTAKIARMHHAEVVELPKNVGKGCCICCGRKAC